MAEKIADKVSITICGDGGCGKSSITLRLVRSQWTSDYDPTIEDSYSVTRAVDGLSYHLSLTDTAGQEEYRGLWAASNLQSDAFLLVYDITNVNSLDGLSWFLDMIDIEAENRVEENNRLLREKGTRVRGKRSEGWRIPPVCIVAGNKCDLKDGRVVSSKMGWEWARARGCGFMETSARELVNIEETFAWIVRRVVDNRRAELGQTAQRSGHTPQTSSSGLRSYGISAQQSSIETNVANGQSMSSPVMDEKSAFDQSPPWWKRILRCTCFA